MQQRSNITKQTNTKRQQQTTKQVNTQGKDTGQTKSNVFFYLSLKKINTELGKRVT